MRPHDYMYSEYLIFIITNIKEHIKNKLKIVENWNGLTYIITYISAALYPGLPNMVPNKR